MVTPNPALLFQFQSLSDQIGGESTGQSLEAPDNCKFLDDKYDWLVKFTDIFPLLTAYKWDRHRKSKLYLRTSYWRNICVRE